MVTQDRLDGWGEITAYLRVADRKTVQRRGYPVRKERTGAVYAIPAELDAHAMPTNAHGYPQTPSAYAK